MAYNFEDQFSSDEEIFSRRCNAPANCCPLGHKHQTTNEARTSSANVKDSCSDVNTKQTQQTDSSARTVDARMGSRVHKLPVFVFPTSLNFYLNQSDTHRQLLTIYNPYDFTVKFSISSNAANKYAVIDPSGSISPQACVDIVVRHKLPIPANCNVTDKFRIFMQDHITLEVIGKKDVESRLLLNEPDNSSNDDGDHFQSLQHSDNPRDAQSSSSSSYHYSMRSPQRLSSAQTANYVILVATLVSIVGLMLPTRQETQPATSIPEYLHMSHHFKLIFAFVLGLVCMVLLRQ